MSVPSRAPSSSVATGLSVFGAAMLLLGGTFQVLQGIALLLDDTLFVTSDGYAYELNPTVWGWIQIVLGVLAILVAVGILVGATWGLITGTMVVAFSALTNFALIPYYPVWALAIITLDVAVVWALCSRIRADRPTGTA